MHANDAPIESPCDEDLDRMRLDPGGLERYCERCSKAVHDLSALGPERARALLAGTRESICISYTADRRGELVFVPLARLAQAATLVASLSACTPHSDETPMEILEPKPVVEALDAAAPVVIPTQPTQPPEPPKPEVEEPCEPEVEPRKPERERLPVKGKYKTAGVYNPPDPL